MFSRIIENYPLSHFHILSHYLRHVNQNLHFKLISLIENVYDFVEAWNAEYVAVDNGKI